MTTTKMQRYTVTSTRLFDRQMLRLGIVFRHQDPEQVRNFLTLRDNCLVYYTVYGPEDEDLTDGLSATEWLAENPQTPGYDVAHVHTFRPLTPGEHEAFSGIESEAARLATWECKGSYATLIVDNSTVHLLLNDDGGEYDAFIMDYGSPVAADLVGDDMLNRLRLGSHPGSLITDFNLSAI